MNVHTDHLLMVGDYKYDIMCGKAAGTKTALLRYREYVETEISPDFEINSIREVIHIIEHFEKIEARMKGGLGLKKRLIVFALFITGFFFFNISAFSGETSNTKTLGDILAEMEKANTAFKTLKASIVYTRTITLLEYTEVSEGELSYKKPKRMYLKFYPPRDEVNVVDGKYVWVYHPTEKQVEKYEMTGCKQSSQGVSFF